MNYAILIPTYNEENRIQKTIKIVETNNYPYIVVNDGSTDKTLDRIISVTDKYITYNINKGKGFAIKEGAKVLIKEGYDWIVIMDADGQIQVKDIREVLKLIDFCPEAKILVGNRLYNPIGMPLLRLWTNKLLSNVISYLSGQKIYDSQCGLKIIHKDVFNLDLKCNRFDFETELLVKAGKKGYKIVSRPIKCIYLEDRKSKMHPIKDALRFFKLLIKLLR